MKKVPFLTVVFLVSIFISASFKHETYIEKGSSILQLSAGGGYRITQKVGSIRKEVGAIYTPPRKEGDNIYKEYWFLSSEYIYPSAENKKDMMVEVMSMQYESKVHFLSIMREKFKTGRLVTVYCSEEEIQ